MYKNIIILILILGLNACNSEKTEKKITAFESKEKLGKSLFFDANLSLERKTSCATCHDPEHGFVDARFSKKEIDQTIFVNGALSVGDDEVSLGGRNAPTASYAMFSPDFDPKEVKGGQFHDGRASTLKDQAMGPPLDTAEMMMLSNADVVKRIEENPHYVKSFKKFYGDDIFDDINASYEAMGEAIAKFEKTDFFAPFDSKYDRLVACKKSGKRTSQCLQEGNWTIDEDLGMSLFFADENTNCINCHQLKKQSDVEGETFTNYEYHNIGVPRNSKAIQSRFDLGLGKLDTIEHGVFGAYKDINKSKDGAIKVPTLRNVAITAPYMHNGIFQKLSTVLAFYDNMGSGERLNNPETNQPWGKTDINSTINHKDLEMKKLSDRKLEALEAFLRTLTDKRYEHLLKKR